MKVSSIKTISHENSQDSSIHTFKLNKVFQVFEWSTNMPLYHAYTSLTYEVYA